MANIVTSPHSKIADYNMNDSMNNTFIELVTPTQYPILLFTYDALLP